MQQMGDFRNILIQKKLMIAFNIDIQSLFKIM